MDVGTHDTTCILRPLLSSDGHFLIVITRDYVLQILRVDGRSSVAICHYLLPRSFHDFLNKVQILSCSPQDPRFRPGADPPSALLLSDGARLIVLSILACVNASGQNGYGQSAGLSPVIAEYQLGNDFGKLIYADFLFNDRHVMVMFELASHASILSTTAPRRDDIPNVKFQSSQSLALAPNARSQAVLLRSRGRDEVAVLTLLEDEIKMQTSFPTNTSDAQGIKWSPGGDPVLVVWDSAAYGIKIAFFSALGHPLKQLDLSSDFLGADSQVNVGITAMAWSKQHENTILAVADGHKRIMVRSQNHQSMTIPQMELLKHPIAIDGSKAIVWQQSLSDNHEMRLEKSAFDAISEPSAGSDALMVKFNCDQSFLATVLADNPRCLWLWQPEHLEPYTINVFAHNVRQVIWYPRQPDCCLILTAQKAPIVYLWHSEMKAPSACTIPLADLSSNRYEAQWIDVQGQCQFPLLFTTPRSYAIGSLKIQDRDVVFESIAVEDGAAHLASEESILPIDTPTRPSKQAGAHNDPH